VVCETEATYVAAPWPSHRAEVMSTAGVTWTSSIQKQFCCHLAGFPLYFDTPQVVSNSTRSSPEPGVIASPSLVLIEGTTEADVTVRPTSANSM